MLLSSAVFKEGRCILWGDLGGCWARGFLLPNEKHYKKVFLDEAALYLEESEMGTYEYGRFISSEAGGKDRAFPIQVTHSLAYADLDRVPGIRLISQLADEYYATVLEKKNGPSRYILVNHAYQPILDLGGWWYQGDDDLSPIVIRSEPVRELPAKIHLPDIEALVWPMDLSGYQA